MTYQSLESTIEILAAGRQEFLTRRAEDVIGQGKGKEDTLRFDNFFEDLLIRGIGRGEAVVLVSEECGKYVPSGNTVPPFADNSLTLIVDPVDMSDPLDEMLKHKSGTVEAVFDKQPRSHLNAPVVSVTAIQDRGILYTLMMNIITGDFYTASQEGLQWQRAANGLIIDSVPIGIAQNDAQTVVAYTGKQKYVDAVTALGYTDVVHAEEGPHRVLYLTSLNDSGRTIGGVVSGDEKVAEWLPWIGFEHFSGGKLVSWIRDPTFYNPATGECNLQAFSELKNPSLYRGDVVVALPGCRLPE